MSVADVLRDAVSQIKKSYSDEIEKSPSLKKMIWLMDRERACRDSCLSWRLPGYREILDDAFAGIDDVAINAKLDAKLEEIIEEGLRASGSSLLPGFLRADLTVSG